MASHDRRLNAFADLRAAMPVTTSDLQSRSMYSHVLKPAMDTVLALIAFIPASIIIAIAALLVSLDGNAPFYRQKRIGKNGRSFNMLKLRSMVPNADEVLEDYLSRNPDAKREWERTQKLKNDPRITMIGRMIRKTSIDELPQLLNVLRGDMSLVGPRPMMLDQRVMYPGVAYYAMRPGITGYWQTSTRNESSFASRASFDTAYFCDMSFKTDMRVMFKTVGVVIAGTGY